MIDGTRTRDNRNHNPGLYQLSYDHRYRRATRLAQPSGVAKRKISRFEKLAYKPDRFPESMADGQNLSFINTEKLTAKIAESTKMGSILLFEFFVILAVKILHFIPPRLTISCQALIPILA